MDIITLKIFLCLISLCFSEGLPAVGVGVALYVNSISLLTSVAAFSEFNLSVFLAVYTSVFLEIVLGREVGERRDFRYLHAQH